MIVWGKELCSVLLDRMHEDGKLNCEVSDGMRYLEDVGLGGKVKKGKNVSVGETKEGKRGKPDVILPFCDVIEGSWCNGVRFNHGLHTQCTNGKAGLGEYCKTCEKSAENSASGKPAYGDIRDRCKFGLDYRDPKGKQTTCYANVADKLGIDLEKAKVSALAFGWTIPAVQLVLAEKKRGRPKGLGAKKSKVVKAVNMSDQIAELVAEAGAELVGSVCVEDERKLELEKMKAKALEARSNLEAAKKSVEDAKIRSVAVVESSSDEDKCEEADSSSVPEKAAKEAANEEGCNTLLIPAKSAEKSDEDLKGEKKAAKKLKKAAKKAAEALKLAEELKAVEKADKKAARKLKKEAKKLKKEEENKEEENKGEEKKEEEDKKERVLTIGEEKALAEEAHAEAFESEKVVEMENLEKAKMDDLGFGKDSEEEIAELVEESEEEDIHLLPEMRVTIDEVEYYKTTAFGLENFLFSYPSGDEVGVYNESAGTIEDVVFE